MIWTTPIKNLEKNSKTPIKSKLSNQDDKLKNITPSKSRMFYIKLFV